MIDTEKADSIINKYKELAVLDLEPIQQLFKSNKLSMDELHSLMMLIYNTKHKSWLEGYYTGIRQTDCELFLRLKHNEVIEQSTK